jgi:hypothetical protein
MTVRNQKVTMSQQKKSRKTNKIMIMKLNLIELLKRTLRWMMMKWMDKILTGLCMLTKVNLISLWWIQKLTYQMVVYLERTSKLINLVGSKVINQLENIKKTFENLYFLNVYLLLLSLTLNLILYYLYNMNIKLLHTIYI